MTTALEQAFPASDVPNATVIARLAQQGIIVVADLDAVSAEDFSIQPWAGICSLADGALFMYDAADTVTAHDGMTVIVVSGRRYKLHTAQIFDGFVASAGDTAPPGSPALGDAYIIGAAPSGDWAAKAKNVAKWTARGWVYRAPEQGMVFWVADEQTFYHYSASDAWTQGLPVTGIADGAIRPVKLFNPLALMIVEDKRNDPPVSVPGEGTAYIVGASPTGAFVGHAGDVAWSTGSGYVFFDPVEGSTVYNRADGDLNTYRSGAWSATTIPATCVNYWEHDGGNVNLGGVNTTAEQLDAIAVQGKASGNRWIIDLEYYHFEGTTNNSGSNMAVEIYVDAESSPRATLYNHTGSTIYDYTRTEPDNSMPRCKISVPDAAAHTIRIKCRRSNSPGGANGDFSSVITRVKWRITEFRPTA